MEALRTQMLITRQMQIVELINKFEATYGQQVPMPVRHQLIHLKRQLALIRAELLRSVGRHAAL